MRGAVEVCLERKPLCQSCRKCPVKRVTGAGRIDDRDAGGLETTNATAIEIEPTLRALRQDRSPPELVAQFSQRVVRAARVIIRGKLVRHDGVIDIGKQLAIPRRRTIEVCDDTGSDAARTANGAQRVERIVPVDQQHATFPNRRKVEARASAFDATSIGHEKPPIPRVAIHQNDGNRGRHLLRTLDLAYANPRRAQTAQKEAAVAVVSKHGQQPRATAQANDLNERRRNHPTGGNDSLVIANPLGHAGDGINTVQVIDRSQPEPNDGTSRTSVARRHASSKAFGCTNA